MQLSHIDDQGKANMVDIVHKQITAREARASALVRMQPATLQAVLENSLAKGDVIQVARIAGIQAAKKTSDLVPLCHPLSIQAIDIHITADEQAIGLRIIAQVRLDGKTGVEMEALTAASIAALTIYDMCKAIDKGMVIDQLQLESKTGGKSGNWHRDNG